jgi:hypothetical protein
VRGCSKICFSIAAASAVGGVYMVIVCSSVGGSRTAVAVSMPSERTGAAAMTKPAVKQKVEMAMTARMRVKERVGLRGSEGGGGGGGVEVDVSEGVVDDADTIVSSVSHINKQST